MTKKKVNQGEINFKKALDFAGYKYEQEYRFNPDRKWRSDFYLPDFNIIVEIEGVTFGKQGGRHQTALGYTCDCEKYNWIVSNGYILFRFTPAMVTGTAKSSRTKPPKDDFNIGDVMTGYIEPAINTLDKYVLGDSYELADRNQSGYIKKYME